METELFSISVKSVKIVSLSQRVLFGPKAVSLTESLSERPGEGLDPFLRVGQPIQKTKNSRQPSAWTLGGCPPHLKLPVNSEPGCSSEPRTGLEKRTGRTSPHTPVWPLPYPLDYRETEVNPEPHCGFSADFFHFSFCKVVLLRVSHTVSRCPHQTPTGRDEMNQLKLSPRKQDV